MPKPLIAGNWKMNTTLEETDALIEYIKNIPIKGQREVVVCPPFVNINRAIEHLKDSQVTVGAQNMYYKDSGAYTGEVSGAMLYSVGVSHVILGHSERREIFKETDEQINLKVKKALQNKLKPILCCGETESQREENTHFEVIEKQLKANLKGISDKDIQNIVIAYEPIWAIGTGKTASSQDAEDMCKFIREIMTDLYSLDIASNLQILYGGSVKPDNISELMSKSNINGALVGGASLDGKEFEQIINYE